MSGKTIDGNIDKCKLADRVLLALYLADRRGYGMCLSHASKMLIFGDAEDLRPFR